MMTPQVDEKLISKLQELLLKSKDSNKLTLGRLRKLARVPVWSYITVILSIVLIGFIGLSNDPFNNPDIFVLTILAAMWCGIVLLQEIMNSKNLNNVIDILSQSMDGEIEGMKHALGMLGVLKSQQEMLNLIMDTVAGEVTKLAVETTGAVNTPKPKRAYNKKGTTKAAKKTKKSS